MSDRIDFLVPGQPVGKGRPRFAKRGNFVQAYTPEKTANYENLVKVCAQMAMKGRALLDGPLTAAIIMEFQIPASWSKKRRQDAIEARVMPTCKPDADNGAKAILDSLNGIVYRDDSQVCVLLVKKRYSETPCATVRIEGMGND